VRRRWPLPPLLTDWPWAIRIVLAGLVPMGFGFLCGAVLGGSGALFLFLQALAAAGGYFAGLEHERPHHGRMRGVLGGVLFGGFILIGHEAVGGSDHGLIPEPALIQIVITAALGALSERWVRAPGSDLRQWTRSSRPGSSSYRRGCA
jgi:hypothetical protein